jgi:hypothetical protein
MSKRDLSRRIEQLEKLLPRCAKHDQLEVFIMPEDEARLSEAANCKNCRGNLIFIIAESDTGGHVCEHCGGNAGSPPALGKQ